MPGRTSPVVATLVALMSTPALAEGVKIDDLVVASPLGDAQAATNLNAVRAFYDFWNTGDETLLKQAVATNFTDHTLPPGRPQGPVRDRPSPPGSSAARCPTSPSRW
jgi:hypothetical protein